MMSALCHLPYGITQRYHLPPDRDERAPP